MKIKKMLASVLAATVVFSISAMTLSVNAAENIVAMELADTTTENTKVVNVYYEGSYSEIYSYNFTISVPSFASDVTVTDLTGGTASPTITDTTCAIASMGGTAKAVDSRISLATVSFTVPTGYEEFELEFILVEGLASGGNELYYEAEYPEDAVNDVLNITVPAWSTGGGDTTVEVGAKGQVYKTYDDAPVFACVADSAVEVADITGKTLTWNIKVGDKVVGTTAANVGTVLSGEESSVVFGLMIINDNNTENFDTIDSAVLVIE